MSAVPVPKASSKSAKVAEVKNENLSPSEIARRDKISEQAKYTDVKRTSSASFKPPMSKDNIPKAPVQPPPKDSSWFAPFSYIKSVFGSKPVATTASTTGEKSYKSDQLNNLSRVGKSKKDAGKYNKYISDSDTKTNDRMYALGTEGKESNMPTLQASNNEVTPGRPKSPSFSISPKDAITKREIPRTYSSNPMFDHDDDVDPTAPKYKQIQGVDNQSTYLHAPDKKGTTSFRITTAPKVGLKQLPTLLSPSFSSQAQQKRPVKMSRKGSTSPHKTRTDIGSARLRSKSTPDSSSIKTRPKIARGYMFSPVDRTPPHRQEEIKKISSWHSQQEHKQKLIKQRHEAALREKERLAQENEESASPLSFITKFLSPKRDAPHTNNATTNKEAPQNKSSDKTKGGHKKSEVTSSNSSGVLESSPSVLENAMEALSSKFSEFTGSSEEPKSKEENTRKNRQGAPSPNRIRSNSYSQDKSKQKTKGKEEQLSPIQSTISMISNFVDTIQSSIEESKKPDPNSKSSDRSSRLVKRPNKVAVEPVDASRSQRAGAEPINESRSESFHRRPGTPSDYNIAPRKRPRPVSSNSLTRVNRSKLDETAQQKQSSPKQSTRKESESATATESEAEELTLAAAFQRLTSLVQSRLSPLVDQEEQVPNETKSQTNEPKQVDSPSSTKPENNNFYYLKKNKASVEGNTKLAREDSSERSKMEGSFLKSRREADKKRHRNNNQRSRSRSVSPVMNAPTQKRESTARRGENMTRNPDEEPPKPKPNSLSTYKKSPSPVFAGKHSQKRNISPYRGASPQANRRKQSSSPLQKDSSPSFHMSSSVARWT